LKRMDSLLNMPHLLVWDKLSEINFLRIPYSTSVRV